MTKGHIASIVVLGMVVVGCSGDPTSSTEYQDLEAQLDAAEQQIDELVAERDALADIAASSTERVDDVESIDLDAYADAWGSGDADRIRAFYTDDAVMMPFGHILSTLSGHPMPEYWDVAGPDMDREAAEHEGGTFRFHDVRVFGNMVVTTGEWTFPEDLFPDAGSTVIETADVWHLRDGKIWRHFADFEVYVDGELIEM